jgi:hypothetical protein
MLNCIIPESDIKQDTGNCQENMPPVLKEDLRRELGSWVVPMWLLLQHAGKCERCTALT